MTVDIIEDPVPLATSWHTRIARFGLRWPIADTAVITADGAIDAANAGELGDYALRVSARCGYLVLDLTGVDFFGTQGFSMLHMFNVRCAKAGVRWAMVPSAAVHRVLRICDPEGGLNAAHTVESALELVHAEPRRLLHLVAQ
ncbi:MAG: STAS domain-containing protein [Mycobacterium sp.]